MNTYALNYIQAHPNYIQAHLHPRTPIHARHHPTSIDTPRTFTSCRSLGWTQAHRHTHGCTVTPPCSMYTPPHRLHPKTLWHVHTHTRHPAICTHTLTPYTQKTLWHVHTHTYSNLQTLRTPVYTRYKVVSMGYHSVCKLLAVVNARYCSNQTKMFLHFICSPCHPYPQNTSIKSRILLLFNTL